jgi:hypothetical protein
MDELVFVLRAQQEAIDVRTHHPNRSLKKKWPEKMSVSILADGGDEGKRPVDAPLVMHVRVWLMGLKPHQLNKMENYLHRVKPNSKDTHQS